MKKTLIKRLATTTLLSTVVFSGIAWTTIPENSKTSNDPTITINGFTFTDYNKTVN
jgi:beta-glucosidase